MNGNNSTKYGTLDAPTIKEKAAQLEPLANVYPDKDGVYMTEAVYIGVLPNHYTLLNQQ